MTKAWMALCISLFCLYGVSFAGTQDGPSDQALEAGPAATSAEQEKRETLKKMDGEQVFEEDVQSDELLDS
ncbi:MAG: hypothetical protein HY586_08100 [Candidatus Omnitrophica bacterium]|nr:hypothetical protein [Candidatus Omnitrophota bacterium]